MSEKLNRQKNADEKKMIVAQHREKQLEYERKRLTRNERAYWLSFFRRFSQSVVKNRVVSRNFRKLVCSFWDE